MPYPVLSDAETFDYRGHSFRVRFKRDDNMGEPWKEHDGHGVVSEWTTRDKAPHERILVSNHYGNSRRYYDVKASTLLARKYGWGMPTRNKHQRRLLTRPHNQRGSSGLCRQYRF